MASRTAVFSVTFCLLVALPSVLSLGIGKYKLTIDLMKPCIVPGRKVSFNVPYTIEQYEAEGESLVRWNVTMNLSVEPLRIHLVMYQKKIDTYNKVYEKTLPCSHMALKLMYTYSNVDVDQTKCRIKAGYYFGDKINPNALIHVIAKVLPYGSFMFHMEWLVSHGCFICHEFYGRVAPQTDP